MTHEQASRYLHRIYRVLGSNEVAIVFKRMKRFSGMCEGDRILIDPTSEILPVLIHEFLHYFYPDEENHPTIDALENEIVSQLTVKQWRNLLIRLAYALRRCDKCGSQLPL